MSKRTTSLPAVQQSPDGVVAAKNLLRGAHARRLADTKVIVNACCPGYMATDFTGFNAPRTPEQGAATAIRLATLPDDGPCGGFFDDEGVVPW